MLTAERQRRVAQQLRLNTQGTQNMEYDDVRLAICRLLVVLDKVKHE